MNANSTQTANRGGRPFRSRLEPHVEVIRAERARRRTWAEIAEALRGMGCPITPQGVHQFYRRYLRRGPSWEDQPFQPRPGPPMASPAATPPPPRPPPVGTAKPFLPTSTFRRPDPQQLNREDYT